HAEGKEGRAAGRRGGGGRVNRPEEGTRRAEATGWTRHARAAHTAAQDNAHLHTRSHRNQTAQIVAGTALPAQVPFTTKASSKTRLVDTTTTGSPPSSV